MALAKLTPKPLPENPANVAALRLERRRQVRGSLLLAAAVLVFGIMRAGVPTIFRPGWWRLW